MLVFKISPDTWQKVIFYFFSITAIISKKWDIWVKTFTNLDVNPFEPLCQGWSRGAMGLASTCSTSTHGCFFQAQLALFLIQPPAASLGRQQRRARGIWSHQMEDQISFPRPPLQLQLSDSCTSPSSLFFCSSFKEIKSTKINNPQIEKVQQI